MFVDGKAKGTFDAMQAEIEAAIADYDATEQSLKVKAAAIQAMRSELEQATSRALEKITARFGVAQIAAAPAPAPAPPTAPAVTGPVA